MHCILTYDIPGPCEYGTELQAPLAARPDLRGDENCCGAKLLSPSFGPTIKARMAYFRFIPQRTGRAPHH